MGNEEYEDDLENKTMAKIDNPDSANELNGDFRIVEYDDNSDNEIEEHIPISNVWQIKKTKKKDHPL